MKDECLQNPLDNMPLSFQWAPAPHHITGHKAWAPAQDTHSRLHCSLLHLCSVGYTGKGRGLHPRHSFALSSSVLRLLLSPPVTAPGPWVSQGKFLLLFQKRPCHLHEEEGAIECLWKPLHKYLTYPLKAMRPPVLQLPSSSPGQGPGHVPIIYTAQDGGHAEHYIHT